MSEGDLLLGLVGILSILSAAVLYPLKLDKIPGLTVFQALILMLIARGADFASFLWVTGGQVSQQELNKIYQLSVQFLPHIEAMVLVQIVGFLLISMVIGCFWLGGSRRGTLTWTAVLTSFSLVATFFNIIGGIPA